MAENRESLRHLIRSKLRRHKFVVVSNREPYLHVYREDRVEWIRPASGVTVALDPVMRTSRGVWVAHGSGPADREVVDADDYVAVPPDRPSYQLKRVWLTKEQEEDYYYGFANAALDRLLERYPQYGGRVVFFQAGVPSRTHVEEYRRLNDELDDRVAAINWKYGRDDWQPVIFVRDQVPRSTLLALYRLARFMIASSLHDGMNLVAKEFVASQLDCNGVLLLSQFTGAARELKDALVINPYSPDTLCDHIREAIEMDPIEVRRRMGRLRAHVSENNIYRWAAEIIRKFSKLT